MPKTNEKDAYFFSHDCNARNDPKILALRSVYGAEGYGVYFMLVEILREQPEYRLSVNKYIWNTLAMQMQVEASHLEQIITDCCTEFAENGSTLLVNDISNLRREAAQKRWKNQPCKADDGGGGASTSNANAEQTDANKRKAKQSKEKQSKAEEKKAKETIFADFASGDADLLSALQDFEAMRNRIKKPMTDQAKKRLVTELEKLAPGDRDAQIAILHQSEDHCWAGVFALKDDRSYQPSRSGRPQQASTGEKMDALRDLHDEFSGL